MSKESFGEFVKKRMDKLGLGLREVSRRTDEEIEITGNTVSAGYFSQLLSNEGDHCETVSIDILWSLGVVLKVDPLHLFVLSRPNIDSKYLDPELRKKIFNMK